MVIATFGRLPSPSASTTSAGTSAPVALPAGTTVERKVSAGNVLPLRDAVELPRPWLGERDVAVAAASSLGDAQFEEHVPVVRCVARGLGCDRPEMRRVDPFTAASDVELASRAVGVGYEAVQGVHAAANDVVALGRSRLHEQEESSVSDDRRHAVDAGAPRRPRWPGMRARPRAAGHRTRPAPEPGGELAPRNAEAVADGSLQARHRSAHRLLHEGADLG